MLLKSSLLGLFTSVIFGLSVLAAPDNYAPEIPIFNEVFLNEDGTKEVVIGVNEDGSFVTEIMDAAKAVNPNDCRHTSIETYGQPKGESKSYNKQYSDKCYKTRTVMDARCLICGRTGLKSYSAWSDKGHKYPLFSSTCEKCNYKK